MRLRVLSLLLLVIASLMASPRPAAAQTPSAAGIAGAWVLNPALTERPAEIGFTQDWADPGRMGGRGDGPGGGRGRGGLAEPPISRESYDDATRVQQLTDDVRTPPARLTIVREPDRVSIADDKGRFRVVHPDGRLEELRLGTVPLPVTTRWDKDSLVIVYDVSQGRQLRYSLTPAADTKRLLVTITFVERGREGDEVRLTYETQEAADSAIFAATRPSSAAGAGTTPADDASGERAPGAFGRGGASSGGASRAGGTSPAGAPSPAGGSPPPLPDSLVPASGARPPVLPPGSELRGLTSIGTVVENLSASAAACGLDQGKVKTVVAKILADAGFKAQPFDDDESYVLVNVLTSRLPDGTCVSRYDVSLVAEADATFSYAKGLVSLPVPLLHDGGLAGGAPAAHAASVMDAVTKSVTKFAGQIRAAAK